MAAPTAGPQAGVELRRTFAAPREKVFDAWINAKLMARWFGRSVEKQPQTKVIEVDPRPGGRYRVEITGPDGTIYKMSGTYREVVPPERLVFTWAWEGADFENSVVSIEFHTLGQSSFTEITLRHEQLPEKWVEGHRTGWLGCFDTLENVLKG